jgi:methionyl-tRNA synthetase
LRRPIFYVNDVPHIGHAYTEVAADVLARWHRQSGDDTWLLTGTDEHGQKILRTAVANGVSPKEWADRLVETAWKPLLETINIANDDFIRTTDERHEHRRQALPAEALRRRLHLPGRVRGPLLRRLRGVQAAERPRPGHGRVRGPAGLRHPLQAGRGAQGDQLLLPDERLRAAAARPLRSNPDFVQPESVRNEITQFVKQGLRDLSISPLELRLGRPDPVG